MELTTSFEGVADEDLAFVLEELELRKRYRSIDFLFPETGALRRELYAKHLEFFRAGAEHRIRAFVAGNRVGKSLASLFEMTLHATGEYPHWWEGRRFDRPTSQLVAGVSYQLTRDSTQRTLLGPVEDLGSGLIPRESLVLDQMVTTNKSSVLVPEISVRHVSGGISKILLRSYEAGRMAFQALALDGILLDEEPHPNAGAELWGECLVRTMTTKGYITLSATPLFGMTQLLIEMLGEEGFSSGAKSGGAYVTCAGWRDVPHLSDQDITEMLAALPPYQRESRMNGIPQIGSGAVYPVSVESLIVEDFPVDQSKGWVFTAGLDVGWANTAVVVLAKDLASDVVYLIREYKVGGLTPTQHSEALKERVLVGPNMEISIDPASQASGQRDGKSIIEEFRKAGLNVIPANNSVEAGILSVLTAMNEGKFRIFASCKGFLSELRTYRRGTDGKVIKTGDHLQDAARYAFFTGLWTQPNAPKAKSTGGIYRGAW